VLERVYGVVEAALSLFGAADSLELSQQPHAGSLQLLQAYQHFAAAATASCATVWHFLLLGDHAG